MDKSKEAIKLANGFARTIGNTGTRTISGLKRILNVLPLFEGKIYNKKTAYDILIYMVMNGVYFPESYFFSEYEKNYSCIKYPEEVIIEKLNEHFVINNSKNKDLYDYANKSIKKFFVGLMNMGLCVVLSNKPIIITDIGWCLLNNLRIGEEETKKYGKPSKENVLMYQAILTSIFCKLPQNAFSASHKKTRKMGNEKRIFPFALGVAFMLGEISPRECLFISAWPNNNVRQCVAAIEDFRVRPYYGKSSLIDYLIDICGIDRKIVFKYAKKTKKEDTESNLIKVFTNQLLPFYKETGLIIMSSDGGFYLNHNEMELINYIIDTYNELGNYESYEEQFNDMQIIDRNFLNMSCDISKISNSIKNYAALYNIEDLKNKVLTDKKLQAKAGDTFELNVNLLLQKLCPQAESIPNYTFDEKMQIIRHAPQGKCDFAMYGEEFTAACEVTLKSKDRDQIRDELESITRHIEELYINNNGKVFGLFIAPHLGSDYSMYIDSFNIFNSMRDKKTDVKIAILSLEELFNIIDILSKEHKEVTIDILYHYFMKEIEEKNKVLCQKAYEKYCLNL